MSAEDEFPEASRWLREMIDNLVPRVSTRWHERVAELFVGADGRQTSIRFDPDNLDDLNNALKPARGASHTYPLTSEAPRADRMNVGTSGCLRDAAITRCVPKEASRA